MSYGIQEVTADDTKETLWNVVSYVDGTEALMNQKQLEAYFNTSLAVLKSPGHDYTTGVTQPSFKGLPRNRFLSDSEWKQYYRQQQGAKKNPPKSTLYRVYVKRPNQKKWGVKQTFTTRQQADSLANAIRNSGFHAMVREVKE